MQVNAVSNRRPLIAHIIHHLGIGGLENGLVNLINLMPDGQYDHAIICLSGFSDFAKRIQRPDVGIYDLKKRPGKDIGCYLRLFRLLRQLQPQIVHTRNFGTLDCQFVATLAGVRVRVHGEHGWDVGDLHGTLGKRVLLRRVSRLVVHHYVPVSKHMASWLENTIGIPAIRVSQIYNGVDAVRFSPAAKPHVAGDYDQLLQHDPSRKIMIGTVGRLDPVKDQLTLLKAFASLVKRVGSNEMTPHLVVVGAGEMRAKLMNFICQQKLDNHVTFTGASEDIDAILKSLDLFVLPSLNEGISNTILEAMATGLPVLASDVGGNPELVKEGVTGSLFSPGDADKLCRLLEDYFNNGELRRMRGAAGRARVMENFSLDAMVERYVRVYEHGIQPGRVPSRTTG